VVDASDNFEARYTINDACVLSGVPLISGSAVGMEGQLTVLNCGDNCPCYRCLHPVPSIAEACRSCANAGVLGPVPGLIGCMQAVETIKVLVAFQCVNKETSQRKIYSKNPSAHKSLKPLCNKQVFYDGMSGEFMTFTLSGRDKSCRVCGDNADIKSMEDSAAHLRQCMEQAVCATTPQDALMRAQGAEVSVQSYLDNVVRTERPHVLLDVRSTTQFGIVSFDYYKDPSAFHQVKCQGNKQSQEEKNEASTSASASFVENLMNEQIRNHHLEVVNIPVRDLKQANIDLLSALRQSVESQASSKPVYVLCRRGIDSVRATELLLQAGVSDVFNIAGGLEAWKSNVDNNFPSY
jgi:adenylyltransferase/sulfurtransferase